MKAQDLKNSVLQLAIQGKLVEQNPNDEPASILLKKIKAEKEQLIKEKKIKRTKQLPEISEEEKTFEIPGSWEWVRLEDIIYSIGSKQNQIKQTQILENGNYPVVSQSINIIEGYSNEIEKLLEIPSSVIVFGDHSRTIKFIDFDFIIGADGTKILVPIKIDAKYLYYVLKYNVINIKDRGYSRHYKFLKEKLIPLPPLEEQKRIVAKIEEVLEKVEEYDKVEKELSELERTFPQDMKKSILQYAIQGKLVEQNLNDEPASVLLDKINLEKEKLIKEKKIKREKPLPEITEEEKQFEIPVGWEWVRLGEISIVSTGSTPLKSNEKYYNNGQIPWVTSSATGEDYINFAETFVTNKAVEECNLKINPIGTLIVAMYGQGKTRGQVSELMIEATTNQACATINMINPELKSYVKIYLKKIYDEIRQLAVGGAQPNLNLNKIKNYSIPIPPLEEQKRIVDKIENIITFVDNLQSRINN
ncbi:restriction endonuclease subunit S [Clostridium perfringens]|uniref:restriction endonuclease subunit S n=1 Tax=Clostridium perfringens TaxID=1502 RepID=UPI002AC6064C|nr:restriction endonuclease subunit S [Clostridium perfringens]MDK0792671.1 restriction endonuclease subunit S [Clostridium perfringens]MDZ4954501.1 restriction endonuclease subunit S [Clostridium perfringens]